MLILLVFEVPLAQLLLQFLDSVVLLFNSRYLFLQLVYASRLRLFVALCLHFNRSQALPLLYRCRGLFKLFLHIVHRWFDFGHHMLNQTSPLTHIRYLGQQVLQYVNLVLDLRERLHVLAHAAQINGINWMFLGLCWFFFLFKLFNLFFNLFFFGFFLLDLSRRLQHTRCCKALVHLFLQIFKLL